MPTLNKIERFTPEFAAKREPPPVYIYAVPTLLNRAQFTGDMVAAGARPPDRTRMQETLREAVQAVVEDDAQPALLEIIDAIEAGEGVTEELERDYRRIVDEVGRLYEPFAVLQGQQFEWITLEPVIAARRFLRGWENVNVKFRRVSGLVADDCLMRLPPEELNAVGLQILRHMYPTADDVGNSAPPSRSGSSPEPSTADMSPSPEQADGTSSASAGT